MNLNQLLYFRILAHFEHYTKAAAELEISQPTLSNAISSLEKELDTFLFEKQGRNVVLTKHGKTFLKYVNASLAILEKGKQEMARLSSADRGHVNLAFISAVGTLLVPEIISNFLKQPQHSNITFSCNEGNTKELLKLLKEDRYDMVICSKRDDEIGLAFIPIYEQKMVVLLPFDHPLSMRESISLRDVQTYPFIMHTHESGMRAVVNQLFEKAGIKPIVSCEVEEDHTIAGLVEAKLGIALVSESPNIKNVNIAIIPLKSPEYKRYIYLTTVKNRHLSPAAQMFKSYVQHYLRLN